MYYSAELFVRKGPLGLLWFCGHATTSEMLRRLRKHVILTSDLVLLCTNVREPPVVLALPTQSALLRGVVRVEQEQAKFLDDDSKEALKMFAYTSRQVTAKQLHLMSEQKIVAERGGRHVTLSEADLTMMADDLFSFDMDHLDMALNMVDERELVREVDLVEMTEEAVERRRKDRAAFTRPLEEITMTPSSFEYSDVEVSERQLCNAAAESLLTRICSCSWRENVRPVEV